MIKRCIKYLALVKTPQGIDATVSKVSEFEKQAYSDIDILKERYVQKKNRKE